MWTINELLQNDNFKDLSKNELLEIVYILRNDLKYYKYRKDAGQEQLSILINTLKSQIETLKIETTRLNKVNCNYRNKLVNPLSLMERIKGQIDLKN